MVFSHQQKKDARIKRSDKSREHLIDAALICFGRDGLEGASIREIAKMAGQNIASISYHFGSKENLYHAVLLETMQILCKAGADVAHGVDEIENTRSVTPTEAIQLLQCFFETAFKKLITDEHGLRVAPLIVREQIRPTPTFDLLYEKGICRTHEVVARLVGIATNMPAEHPKTIVRAHSLFGQFFVLITSRETLLRRMGWTDFKRQNEDLVISVINENIRVLLNALRQLNGSKSSRIEGC